MYTPSTMATGNPNLVNVGNAEVSNPDGIRPTYANQSTIGVSPFDVRMVFTEINYVPNGGPTQNLMRANVVMSPAQAKAFANALQTSIEQFEAQFGQIAAYTTPVQG